MTLNQTHIPVKKQVLLIIMLLFGIARSSSQIAIANTTPVAENFNSMGATLLCLPIGELRPQPHLHGLRALQLFHSNHRQDLRLQEEPIIGDRRLQKEQSGR